MILKGQELKRAYTELAGADPVRADDVLPATDEKGLAFLGDRTLYELTEVGYAALEPLMDTWYSATFAYNGAEYQFDDRILRHGHLELKSGDVKRHFIYPTGGSLEFLQGLARLKSIVEFIDMKEQERWAQATRRAEARNAEGEA